MVNVRRRQNKHYLLLPAVARVIHQHKLYSSTLVVDSLAHLVSKLFECLEELLAGQIANGDDCLFSKTRLASCPQEKTNVCIAS